MLPELVAVLDQLADVYTAAPVSGRYTVLLKERLACRLLHVGLQPGATAPDRDELAARRDMMFDPSFRMPEQCQVEVDNVRWVPQPGTFGAPRDWNSTVAYKRCNLIRQQTGAF